MQTPRIPRSSVTLGSAIMGACLVLSAVLLPADSRAQIYIGAEGGWTGLPGRPGMLYLELLIDPRSLEEGVS